MQGNCVLANWKGAPCPNFIVRAQVNHGGNPEINDRLGVVGCQSIQAIGPKQRSPTRFSPVGSWITAKVTKVVYCKQRHYSPVVGDQCLNRWRS
jgi:hypothetical protein